MTVSTDPRKTGVAASMTLLAASAVAVSVTGTTSETVLATVTIPAGAMGLNGGVRIVTRWSMAASANNKTSRHRLGGIAGSVIASVPSTTSTALLESSSRNRGSPSSQYHMAHGNRGTDLVMAVLSATTSAIDMTQAQDLVITGQLALGTETLTLDNYEVWLLP
jgi:hypothetical protein